MRYGENTTPEVEAVAAQVVDAAYRVHKELGPGLLESVYETCLEYELKKCNLHVDRQLPLPIPYDGQLLGETFRLDLVVERCVIVEVKAVEQMIPLYLAQTMTYLKLSGRRLALLINFNVPLIKEGIKRVIR